MAQGLPLPKGEVALNFGNSFSKTYKEESFHSIRYDFKPASVDTKKKATVVVGEGSKVSVNVPNVEGSGVSETAFRGQKTPAAKECILVFDRVTGEFTLERVSQRITVKKTRPEPKKPQNPMDGMPHRPSPTQGYSPSHNARLHNPSPNMPRMSPNTNKNKQNAQNSSNSMPMLDFNDEPSKEETMSDSSSDSSSSSSSDSDSDSETDVKTPIQSQPPTVTKEYPPIQSKAFQPIQSKAFPRTQPAPPIQTHNAPSLITQIRTKRLSDSSSSSSSSSSSGSGSSSSSSSSSSDSEVETPTVKNVTTPLLPQQILQKQILPGRRKRYRKNKNSNSNSKSNFKGSPSSSSQDSISYSSHQKHSNVQANNVYKSNNSFGQAENNNRKKSPNNNRPNNGQLKRDVNVPNGGQIKRNDNNKHKQHDNGNQYNTPTNKENYHKPGNNDNRSNKKKNKSKNGNKTPPSSSGYHSSSSGPPQSHSLVRVHSESPPSNLSCDSELGSKNFAAMSISRSPESCEE